MNEAQQMECEATPESTTRDVLQKWNNYYINNTFGIGIQCDRCNKWREVFQYEDRNQVPATWTCSLWRIDENRRGSCRMPSNLTEDDFIEAQFSPGDLVYAKMNGFPWWPAMIEDCPDDQQYFMTYDYKEDEYHVNFFGDKALRRWIGASNIKDYSTPSDTNILSKRMRKYRKRLQKSIEEANEALKMSVKDRLKKFSFAIRYKGRWAKIDSEELLLLPPPPKEVEKPSEFRLPVTRDKFQNDQVCPQNSIVSNNKKSKSKLGKITKSKSVEEESRPKASHEDIKDNNSNEYWNQLDAIKGPLEEVKQLPGHSDSEVQPHINSCCVRKTSYSLPRKRKQNSSLEYEGDDESSSDQQSILNEVSDQIPFKETSNLGKTSNKNLAFDNDENNHNEDNRCSKISSDSESDSGEISQEHKAYLEFLNKKYSPLIYDTDTEFLSDIEVEKNNSIGSSNMVVTFQNASTISESEPIIADGNAVSFLNYDINSEDKNSVTEIDSQESVFCNDISLMLHSSPIMSGSSPKKSRK